MTVLSAVCFGVRRVLEIAEMFTDFLVGRYRHVRWLRRTPRALELSDEARSPCLRLLDIQEEQQGSDLLKVEPDASDDSDEDMINSQHLLSDSFPSLLQSTHF